MKLFEFLERVTKEKFPFQINYIEWSGCVDVDVNAFTERWIVSFDEDGFVDFRIFKDIGAPDNENAELLELLFPNSTAKCDTLQYQATNAISLKTIAGCLKSKHFFGR